MYRERDEAVANAKAALLARLREPDEALLDTLSDIIRVAGRPWGKETVRKILAVITEMT